MREGWRPSRIGPMHGRKCDLFQGKWSGKPRPLAPSFTSVRNSLPRMRRGDPSGAAISALEVNVLLRERVKDGARPELVQCTVANAISFRGSGLGNPDHLRHRSLRSETASHDCVAGTPAEPRFQTGKETSFLGKD